MVWKQTAENKKRKTRKKKNQKNKKKSSQFKKNKKKRVQKDHFKKQKKTSSSPKEQTILNNPINILIMLGR